MSITNKCCVVFLRDLNSFCLSYIVLLLFYIGFASKIAHEQVDPTSENAESMLENVKIINLISFIVLIVIQLIGMIAVYKEHFYLLLVHIILNTLGVFTNLIQSFYKRSFWGLTIWSILVTGVGILYFRDICKQRRLAQDQITRVDSADLKRLQEKC